VEHEQERRLKELRLEEIENEIHELELKNEQKRAEILKNFGKKEQKNDTQ
jgi:hypothetical protein